MEINKLWSEIKQKEKDFNEELKKLQIRATKKKSSLLNFWATRPTAAPKPDDEEVQVLTPAAAASSAEESSSTSSNSACRGQEIIKKIKSTIQSKISDLSVVQQTIGLTPPTRKEMGQLCKQQEVLEKKLNRTIQNQKSQQKLGIRKGRRWLI